jgi:hypothetical protein
MNARERLLSILIGSCLVLVFGYWSISAVWGWFDYRDQRIETLRRDLRKKKEDLMRVQIAAKKLADYEARSLPREVDVAQSLYQTWLLNTCAEAKLADVVLDTKKPRAKQRTYHELGYSITARGTLPQVVDWLYRFEQEDRLHRLESFALKPIKNSKELQITLNVGALSVDSAPKAEELLARPRADYPPLASFQEPIVQRNFFGPPNQPPRFTFESTAKAYVGRSFDFTTKATDSDALDKLSFTLLQGSQHQASLDRTSGRLNWTPPALGEYEFEVEAQDDGLPAKASRQTFKVVVSDPPPPPPPAEEGPKKLSFDAAKHTVYTATLEANGLAEAWLHNRITSEIPRLHVGDTFAIGSVAGKVQAIEEASLEYESQGKRYRLLRGQLLAEAVVVTLDN